MVDDLVTRGNHDAAQPHQVFVAISHPLQGGVRTTQPHAGVNVSSTTSQFHVKVQCKMKSRNEIRYTLLCSKF